MRIVSYNVRYFGHALKGLASTAGAKTRISRAIASLRELPDVGCLQEVETRPLRSGLAHRGGHAGGLCGPGVWGGPGWLGPGADLGGSSGPRRNRLGRRLAAITTSA